MPTKLASIEFQPSAGGKDNYIVALFDSGNMVCTCPMARYVLKGSGYSVLGPEVSSCRHMHEARELPEFKSAIEELKKTKPIQYDAWVTEQAPVPATPFPVAQVPATSNAAVNAALRRAAAAEKALERLQRENAKLRTRAKKTEPPPLTEQQQHGSIESMHERRIRLGPSPDDEGEAKGVTP